MAWKMDQSMGKLTNSWKNGPMVAKVDQWLGKWTTGWEKWTNSWENG